MLKNLTILDIVYYICRTLSRNVFRIDSYFESLALVGCKKIAVLIFRCYNARSH